jgi:hypothetical protein
VTKLDLSVTKLDLAAPTLHRESSVTKLDLADTDPARV